MIMLQLLNAYISMSPSDVSIGCSVLILTPKRRPGRDTASFLPSHCESCEPLINARVDDVLFNAGVRISNDAKDGKITKLK